MSQKLQLHIKGMHCRSCEVLLERNISKVQGVRKVYANYKHQTVDVTYDTAQPDMTALEKAVIHSGYALGLEDKKSFFSKDPLDYFEVAAVLSILFVIYAIFSRTDFSGWGSKIGSTPGLIGVLLVGLTAGVSTCMALIGGLVLGISARHAERHPEATTFQKFRPHIFFNLGRLISYAVLGGAIGLLGWVFKLSSGVLGFITIGLGLIMIILGLKLINIFPRLSNTNIVLPKAISKLFGLHRENKEYSHHGAFITGALTFFIPCGFTQAMQLYAVSTGSFIQGGLIMFLFALGTAPGILSLGGLSSIVKGSLARYFFKFVGVVVILLALWNISNGFSLSGISLAAVIPTAKQEVVAGVQAKIENGKQIVEMEQVTNGYRPNQFTIKKGIPVLWKIRSTSSYTCAAYINMPSYCISQPLQAGENVIEFTPTQTGKVRFTCSIGMFAGTFNVID